MAKSLLLAWASPASQESAAEFEEWYEGTHIPQVRAAIPSISAVARYALADPVSGETGTSYLAIYELDDDDVPAAAGALQEAVTSGRMQMTAAMDLTDNPPVTQWYRQLPRP